MKTLVALLGSVALLSMAVGQTSTPPETKTPPARPRIVLPGSQPAPMAGADKNAPSATTTSPAPKAGEKSTGKKEEPPKIEGITISRGEKGFLGIEIVNSTFKLSFYDAKKKPVAPDAARAVLRWDPKYKVGKERIVLNSDGGKSLTNARSIRAPYNFKLFISLFKDAAEGDETGATESYVIDFKQ